MTLAVAGGVTAGVATTWSLRLVSSPAITTTIPEFIAFFRK